jgi:surface polysaccharide O-acyltransferase-like enzyme
MSRQPAKTLVISFIVQIVLIFLDYHVLQAGRFSTNQAVTIFVEFQNRYLPLYEFFFVLGGFAALYIDTCKVFLANYGRYIPALMAGALTLFVLYYVLQLQGLHYSLGLATQVLQPSVVLYSTVVIVFFCWVASKWAIKRRLYKIVKSVADTSFGIYFVHILILNYLVQHALPHLSDSIPVPIKIIGLIIATFSLAASFCYILFRIPLLSWTIGKVQPLKFPKFRTTTPS